MTKLLTKNSKITKSNSDTHTVYNFGIPAYESKTGLKTCPNAGICAKGCYAQSGAYNFSNVAQAFENRLADSLSDNFPALLGKELAVKVKTAKRQGKQLVIRIHDSGDFYNMKYALKWLSVMNNFPTVQFYAYTKQVVMFKGISKIIPDNFTLIFSEGGLLDSKIDQAIDRHSRVFESLEALLAAGYTDTSENDLNAITAPNGKVGLIYHGFESKKWTTG